MTWLTWRQFRAQAGALAAVVAAFAVLLAITGPGAHSGDASTLFDRLTSTERTLYTASLVVTVVAPAVIGVFWGAPLVARELESGTHRLAWSQTVTRNRWLAVKLGVTAVATLLVTGLLTLAVSWWAGPLDGAAGSLRGGLPSRLSPAVFGARDVVPLGYALFALVLGVAAGLVVRRTVPAMALTLGVLVVVQLAVPLALREHLVPPVRETVAFSEDDLDGISLDEDDVVTLQLHTGDPGAWLLTNRTVDADGDPVALPGWFAECLPGPRSEAGATAQPVQDCLDRLTDEGYRQELVYQPDRHFWPLQWAETGLYLTLAGLLAGFCAWWTRRRLS